MISFLPANTSKLSTIVPILHSFLLSEVLNDIFIINIDDSGSKIYGDNILEELKYWGINKYKCAYLSSISGSAIEKYINELNPNFINIKEVELLVCNCGKLELFGRDLQTKLYSDMKVFANGKCKFCNTSYFVKSRQLFLTFDTSKVPTEVYPKNMSKFLRNKLNGSFNKEYRISRVRKTLFTIGFKNEEYFIDPDFVSNLSLRFLLTENQKLAIFSQRRTEKLLFLSSILNTDSIFVGIPYFQNFIKYYPSIKSQTNNIKYLIVFLALSTSWRNNYNYCNEKIFRSFQKLSSTDIEKLYALIITQITIENYLKNFNNNLLSYI